MSLFEAKLTIAGQQDLKCSPKAFWEVERAYYKPLRVNILVRMAVPFLKVPGDACKLKTDVSVSIWNLIA